MRGPEEWPSRSNPADRIRLTGPAALIYFVFYCLLRKPPSCEPGVTGRTILSLSQFLGVRRRQILTALVDFNATAPQILRIQFTAGRVRCVTVKKRADGRTDNRQC